jgi:hypothetical protein
MRSPLPKLVLSCVVAAGCSSAAPPRTETQSSFALSRASSSAPALPAEASAARSSTPACDEACTFLDGCPAKTFVGDRSRCRGECAHENAKWQRAYAICVAEVGCDLIHKSMAMNEGPLGECLHDRGAFQ